MKIYEGTFNNTSATLKRDLVPCYRKKDNVSGVYDLVTKTFYTSTIPLKTGYPINQIYEMDVTGGGGGFWNSATVTAAQNTTKSGDTFTMNYNSSSQLHRI